LRVIALLLSLPGMTKLLFVAAATLALSPVVADAQEPPPRTPAVTAEQMIRMDRLASPAVSPDGRFVAYQVTETDEAYQRSTGLLIVDTTNNAAAIPIADLADANESAPAFSADGRRLYFLSNKSGSNQLWFVDLTISATGAYSGTPVQASDTVAAVAGFRLSPDGRRVLLTGEVELGCPHFGCRGNSGFSQSQPGPGSARVYDEMFVRHWDHWETPGTYNRT
jgi:dipeptidyl aminopeptidase/acylaminoacyl peptidase